MNFNNIETLNGKYIIHFPDLTNKKMDVDGFEIAIDTKYRRQHRAAEIGTVVATTNDGDILVGDTVFVQYLVVEEKNRIHHDETGYYQLADRDQVFAVIRGEDIIMLDGFILVQPEDIGTGDYKEEDGVLIPKEQTKGKEVYAIVKYVPSNFDKVEVGDKVRIHRSAQYPIEINGEKYYRVRTDVGLIWRIKKDELELQG